VYCEVLRPHSKNLLGKISAYTNTNFVEEDSVLPGVWCCVIGQAVPRSFVRLWYLHLKDRAIRRCSPCDTVSHPARSESLATPLCDLKSDINFILIHVHTYTKINMPLVNLITTFYWNISLKQFEFRVIYFSMPLVMHISMVHRTLPSGHQFYGN